MMEYMERGSLSDVLNDKAIPLSAALRSRMALEAARGMLYLHTLKPPVLHRDLKSPNLLVDHQYRVKIADFGLSRFRVEYTMTFCGSPKWTAPEVLNGLSYDTAADVWSYGVVVWELLTRQVPYAAGTWQPARRQKPRRGGASPTRAPHSPVGRTRGASEAVGAARGGAGAWPDASPGVGVLSGGGGHRSGGSGSGSGTAGGMQGGQGNGNNGSSRESVQALADAVELLGSQVAFSSLPMALRHVLCGVLLGAPALPRALLLCCFSSVSRVHARHDGARCLPLRRWRLRWRARAVCSCFPRSPRRSRSWRSAASNSSRIGVRHFKILWRTCRFLHESARGGGECEWFSAPVSCPRLVPPGATLVCVSPSAAAVWLGRAHALLILPSLLTVFVHRDT